MQFKAVTNFVSKRTMSSSPSGFGPLCTLNTNLLDMHLSPSLAINEEQTKLINEGKKISRMGFGASPFPVPEAVQQRLRENTDKKYYLPVRGLPELRECVARTYTEEIGVEYDTEDVFVAPGTKENLFILQLAYNADLILPSPSWVSYAPQAQIIGRRTKWIHTKIENGFKLTAEELEQELSEHPDRARILVLNSPNNPTGMCYSADELKDIAELCRAYRVLVLSDEIYSPLTFDGLKHTSIASMYPEGTVILNGLSKWGGAGGYRLGFFIFPSNLRWLQNAMAIIASETYSSCSAPIQYAAVAAFEDYHGEEMQRYLKVSRTVLNALAHRGFEALSEIEGCAVNRSNGGFYVFPDFSAVPGIREVCADSHVLSQFLLHKAGVSGLGGHCFGRDPKELTIKFSFVDFDGKDIFDDLENMPIDAPIESQEMDAFVWKHCANTLNGFEAVKDIMTPFGHNKKPLNA